VAHGSDLLMQLALNPRLDKEALGLVVSGVRVQVAPKGHAYVAGESERLARPILFAAQRGFERGVHLVGGHVGCGREQSGASKSRDCQCANGLHGF
jgi:hypothetical protein